MTSKHIVILGGGVAGLVVANELRNRLARIHRVTVLERNEQHAFAPSFLWVMTGRRTPEQITRKVRELLAPGVELIHDEALRIDLNARQVHTTSRVLGYDYLVIAVGAALAPETIPGLSQAAHTFYTLEGATKLQQAIVNFPRGKVAFVVSSTPYKCPGAPLEAAMLLSSHFRSRVEIHFYTPEPQPLPVAGPQLGETVRNLLETKDVRFHAKHRLIAIDPETRQMHFEGQASTGYDLLIAIPPHRAPNLVATAGLLDQTGWIPVDRATLSTGHEGVYAIGDVVAIGIPGRWKPETPLSLPKAGVFAHAQALVVAHTIAAAIKGRVTNDSFCGGGFCILEAGEDLAGLAYGNFFAAPSPDVRLSRICKHWHLAKILFEKWWLSPFGLRREILRRAIELGAKSYGIPVRL